MTGRYTPGEPQKATAHISKFKLLEVVYFCYYQPCNKYHHSQANFRLSEVEYD